ncbi:MAG: hypothetical protein RI894_1427, partial [Bacteroidota bacterium]|jgi:predicted DNA-binding transcriptional regulator AlpA
MNTSNTKPELPLTRKEMASFLGISRKLLSVWIAEMDIPKYKQFTPKQAQTIIDEFS